MFGKNQIMCVKNLLLFKKLGCLMMSREYFEVHSIPKYTGSEYCSEV